MRSFQISLQDNHLHVMQQQQQQKTIKLLSDIFEFFVNLSIVKSKIRLHCTSFKLY